MHLKYRPKSWDEVIGNQAIKKSLNSLTYKRHILLHGSRGCGKTTIANLVAQSYGAHPDNIEIINCFEQNDVASMRERIAKLEHTTIFGANKVIIFDEVHGLSKQAMETLLIPLEKEVSNYLIISCTTEPDKLPKTFFDRCLDYKVQPLTYKESLQLLNYVCGEESLSITNDLKILLLEKANGNPRVLLKGLTKVKDITDLDEAAYLLDIIEFEDNEDVLTIFKLLIQERNTKNVFDKVKVCLKNILKDRSPESVRVGLMNLIAGNIMSNWFDINNSTYFIKLYNLLYSANGFPEKANLIMAILGSLNG